MRYLSGCHSKYISTLVFGTTYIWHKNTRYLDLHIASEYTVLKIRGDRLQSGRVEIFMDPLSGETIITAENFKKQKLKSLKLS